MVLLGDRLGWRPPPNQIPADEFDEILRSVSPEDAHLLQEWYLRDDNAVPPHHYLKPRVAEFVDPAAWFPIEQTLRSILESALADMTLEAADRLKYEASWLEQEIHHGALRMSEESARAATGKERAILAGHTDKVTACAISPDGSYVVSASHDRTCRIWDALTGRGRAILAGHTDKVTACAISPDGSYVVSASHDRTCRIWNAATREELAILPLSASCVALHPWEPFAACGDSLGGVHLIEPMTIQHRAIVVTAVETGGRRTIRCPKCWQAHPLNGSWLGRIIECPPQPVISVFESIPSSSVHRASRC